MAGRTECYLDTSAFIAFLDKSDSHSALYRRLFTTPPRLTVSSLVIAEGHAWFLRRYDATRHFNSWDLFDLFRSSKSCRSRAKLSESALR